MITLYKKGNTHTVKGIECELKNFEIHELKYAISLGYFTDIGKINNPAVNQADQNNSGKLSAKEVRAAAKNAGIKGYSKAKLSDLKKELGYEN